MKRCESLIDRISQINGYLVREAKSEYNELIESLNSLHQELDTAKPVVEIVSPSPPLADNFRKKILTSRLRSRFEFQCTPITNIQQIVRCDLICLIYYFKNTVNKQHQKLIELARQNDIDLILLVRQPDRNLENASLSSWLETQDCLLDGLLPLDDFINLNQPSDIDLYRQLLWRSLEPLKAKFIARQQQELRNAIEVFFDRQIASIEPLYPFIETPPHHYRPQLEQISNSIRQEKQQLLTIIKQNINYLRLDLLNPFIAESLMFSVRQIIDLAAVEVVSEARVTYLYLTVNNSVQTQYIHDYVIELCQQKIKEIIAFQWSQIEYVYGGGINSLIDKVNGELKTITNLIDFENDFIVLDRPSLDLRKWLDVDCLKNNSRIIFDYHFTQGSWFRLLMSGLIGLGIYFVTLVLLGSGKYIGLVIFIFQVVNLFTGQNPKKVKLKQHSKELKRFVDGQYQNLVRLIVDKSIQTLIIALERHKLDANELEKAIALTRTRLKRSSTTNVRDLAKIELQQQKDKILSWLD